MTITNDELIMRLKFIKENNGNWYIDLPNWTGRKSALQMVSGADTLLDLMSEGSKSVEIFVSHEDFDGAELLEKKRNCWFNGADYFIKTYDNKVIDLDVWLCDVTKHVLGDFPDEIYFAKFNEK
jgi:hypothetical protein